MGCHLFESMDKARRDKRLGARSERSRRRRSGQGQQDVLCCSTWSREPCFKLPYDVITFIVATYHVISRWLQAGVGTIDVVRSEDSWILGIRFIKCSNVLQVLRTLDHHPVAVTLKTLIIKGCKANASFPLAFLQSSHLLLQPLTLLTLEDSKRIDSISNNERNVIVMEH